MSHVGKLHQFDVKLALNLLDLLLLGRDLFAQPFPFGDQLLLLRGVFLRADRFRHLIGPLFEDLRLGDELLTPVVQLDDPIGRRGRVGDVAVMGVGLDGFDVGTDECGIEHESLVLAKG
jgi:hypothetical protein